MTTSTVGSVLHAFFCDYLTLQKGLRPNSLRSYGDAMRLFLLFAANDVGCKITRLSLDDLTADTLSPFRVLLGAVKHRRRIPEGQKAVAEYRSFGRPWQRICPDVGASGE